MEKIIKKNEVMDKKKGAVHIQSREEHTSGRHGRVWKVRREEGRYDYQGNTEKKKIPIGKKETESGEQTKRRKSKGEEREWEDGERERKREERID